MVYINKKEAEEYVGDGFSGIDYKKCDNEIDFAIIKVNGHSPKSGYQVNTECKELLYITEGSGTLTIKNVLSKIRFSKGDVIIINRGELYAFDGNFEASVSCTPAWTQEQHQYIANW